MIQTTACIGALQKFFRKAIRKTWQNNRALLSVHAARHVKVSDKEHLKIKTFSYHDPRFQNLITRKTVRSSIRLSTGKSKNPCTNLRANWETNAQIFISAIEFSQLNLAISVAWATFSALRIVTRKLEPIVWEAKLMHIIHTFIDNGLYPSYECSWINSNHQSNLGFRGTVIGSRNGILESIFSSTCWRPSDFVALIVYAIFSSVATKSSCLMSSSVYSALKDLNNFSITNSNLALKNGTWIPV